MIGMTYWWIFLIAACATLGVGATLWLFTATALTRAVSPSADWLDRQSRYNRWGSRLVTVGAALAVIGIALAIGHWLGT
jgi:predicted PurR-regulated permease PerM